MVNEAAGYSKAKRVNHSTSKKGLCLVGDIVIDLRLVGEYFF